MTIQEAISRGSLPNIDPKKMINVCAKLGIPARDLSFSLTDDQLKRLQYDPSLHRSIVTAQVKDAHKTLISEYDELIKKYQSLSERMDKNPDLSSKKGEIDKLLSDLITARDEYNGVVKNVFITRDNMGFDINVTNPVNRTIMGIVDGRLQKQGAKLNAEYAKLDKLQANKFKTKFKQKRNAKKIQKVAQKIAKLQGKQGKLQTTQRKIVNKGSSKYAKIKSKEFLNYRNDLQRYTAYADAKEKNIQAQRDYASDLAQTRMELHNLESQIGVGNALDRAKNTIARTRLQFEQRKLKSDLTKYQKQEKMIERLKGKRGMCRLSEQIYRQVAMSYAM